jgi:four helix bundle protein
MADYMAEKIRKISDRLLDFGVDIIKLTMELNKNIIGRTIANQLLRSGTSAGANYEETYGAESRTDFIHKLQIVLKELQESLYWLKLIKKSEILKNTILYNMIDETEQLCKIIAQSVITAKNNR